ncbi:MAG: ComEC/Rec2 family competence protein [Gaiellales bacterium]
MWSCDPATRLVLAALTGLVAAALGRPVLAAAAMLLGRPWPVVLGVAAFTCWWGLLQVDSIERRILTPGPVHATAVVTGQPRGARAVARLRPAGEDVVLVAPGERLQQGGVYRVTGQLRPLDPVIAGYYATQGAHLELRASNLVLRGRREGMWGAVDSVHRALVGGLGGEAVSPQRGLVEGIVLGEDGALSRRERQRFQDSGLYHLVAVSGQNVAMVVAFTVVALGICGVIGSPARLAAAALTVAYVLVTGAGPSIVRAGVAGTLVSVAWLASRPVARWHLVALGAVTVLALNPLELFDPGFQLSFAAVCAIFVVAPRLQSRLGQAAAISVACTLVTTPIAWWHFGRVAPLAVPANLLALPVVAPILWLGLAAIALGAVAPPLAQPLLGLADLLASYLLWVAELCS